MKGESVTLNGDQWTIVDVAPAAPLAEMVAAILEDEGMVALVRGADLLADVFSHLGSTSAQVSYVLVPAGDAERALAVIAETVTDYEGEELDELLARMERGEVPDELAASEWQEDDDPADHDPADREPADHESADRESVNEKPADDADGGPHGGSGTR